MTITDDVLRLLARSAAQRLPYPPSERPNVEACLVSMWRAELSSMFGGEVIRLYAGRRAERVEQRQRIQRAVEAGAPIADVARREGVSERWVRTLRRVGTIRP